MQKVIVAIGVILVLLGIAATLRPRVLQDLARKVTVHTWLRVTAFVIRVALGLIFVLVAPSTSFPLLLQVIGALLIFSGVLVLMLGNEGVQRLLNWVLRRGPTGVMVGGIAAILFGGFLIYLGI